MKSNAFMILRGLVAVLFVVISSHHSEANPEKDNLQVLLEQFVSATNSDIGISVIEPGTNSIISVHGDVPYPMLSTFKFPIALAILHKVENGQLTFQQTILVTQAELVENTFSPFKEKFPEGNIEISLEEALMWMIVYSDNNITDILIRLAGGLDYVEEFIGDANFIFKNNEVAMHVDWDSQFANKATPNAYTKLLKAFAEQQILNKENTELLYQAMVTSKTGTRRLKGKLPSTVIAQRAGTSFTNEKGITGAINNVGIIELPDKRKVYIAVFIRNTSEGFDKGEEMIADIGKLVYDYYSKQ
jgi:beta-lactamase class A